MKILFIALILAVPAAEAQIYRCETPDGTVFADEPCGEGAKVVTIEEDSSGITAGPPEEVRGYLVRKREERADEQEARQRAQAAQPPGPVYVPVPVEQPVIYPGYWWRHPRPHPPRPEPPPEPPPDPGSVLRLPDD